MEYVGRRKRYVEPATVCSRWSDGASRISHTTIDPSSVAANARQALRGSKQQHWGVDSDTKTCMGLDGSRVFQRHKQPGGLVDVDG